MMDQRIRIDTGARTTTATNPFGTWATTATDTRWCEAIPITPAEAVERYQVPFDEKVMWELRFQSRPTMSIRDSRFVWATNGHPKRTTILWPRSAPINVDGQGRVTTILVEEDPEEVASV